MDKIEQYFYKYTVTYCEEIDEKCELKTVAGLTFGKTYNEVCAKVTDYFGEDTIDEIKIEFVGEYDVLEESEIVELFNLFNTKTNAHNITSLADEIKDGLSEAIEYEKGNVQLRTTELSMLDEH